MQAKMQAKNMPAKGALPFESGSLSGEEIEGIFNALPVDITFVSPKDEVRYFSKLGKRIFPRSLAVIGRKVQQCHPQESLDKVNAILSDFKSRKRDMAEFWINMKGMPPKEGGQRLEGVRGRLQASERLQSRMIHIRYFAVRNKRGKYLGCLEVSQDITGIQKLRGEKRL